MAIDRMLGAARIAERLDRTTNQRQRAMLEVVREHMAAEANLDLDGLLVGQVDEPNYHLWGSGRDTGPKGREAVIGYYAELAAAKRGFLEYDIERIVVDDATIVTEGFIRAYQPGPVARDFGFDVDDPDAVYLVRYRALVLWPFDADGRLLGEDGYGGVDPADATRVEHAELPQEYLDQFGTGALPARFAANS